LKTTQFREVQTTITTIKTNEIWIHKEDYFWCDLPGVTITQSPEGIVMFKFEIKEYLQVPGHLSLTAVLSNLTDSENTTISPNHYKIGLDMTKSYLFCLIAISQASNQTIIEKWVINFAPDPK